MEQSFIAYIENSIKQNWDLDALTDYNVKKNILKSNGISQS